MTKQSVLDMAKNEVKDVLKDYFLAVASREASLLGRKEVFMGKAKFGIFGDGNLMAQLIGIQPIIKRLQILRLVIFS